MSIGKVALSYASLMYEAMDKEATEENSSDSLYRIGVPLNVQLRIFRGSLYEIGTRNGLSHSACTKGMGILYAMNAATKLINGGPGTKTILTLNYKPTIAQYEEFLENNQLQTRKFAPTQKESMLDELSDLRVRVARLEKIVAQLAPE